MSVLVPRCFAPPRTLGGNANLRFVKLEKKHLTREDTSLNAQIWDLWTLEERLMDMSNVTLLHYHNWVSRAQWGLAKEGLTNMIMTLLECEVGNVVHAQIKRKIAQKAAERIEPVGVVVKRIKATKEEVNGTVSDMGYMECIIDLIPWFESPALLTAEQAYDTGLAELEAQIWNNFFLASFKLLPGGREFTHDSLLCDAAVDAVLQARYASSRLLCKARYNYIKFFETQGRAEIQAELPYLKALLDEMKDKTSGKWAHRDCLSEHVCFTDAGRALVRKPERPEEKAKRLPGDGPEPTAKGYTWGKVGQHVWGNLHDGQSFGV